MRLPCRSREAAAFWSAPGFREFQWPDNDFDMNVQPSDTGAGNAPSLPDTLTHDSLLDSVAWLCAHYGLGRSHAVLISGLAKYGLLTPSLALEALTQAGLAAKLVERPLMQLPEHLLPAVLLRRNGSACVLLGRRIDDSAERDPQIRYRVMLPELGEAPVECTDAELGDTYSGYALLVKPAAKVDARPDDLPTEPAGHWLLRTLWRYRSYYASAAVGAFLINVLGLASVFFTMNVYDRVVPNQAYVTLWSLAIGVALAMLMEAVSRHVRAHVLDTAGRRPIWCSAACCSGRRWRSGWSIGQRRPAPSRTGCASSNRCGTSRRRRRCRSCPICRSSFCSLAWCSRSATARLDSAPDDSADRRSRRDRAMAARACDA